MECLKHKLIGYADANQRRDRRRAMLELRFIIDHEAYPVRDLSMSGFLLNDEGKKLRGGQEVLVTEVGVDDGPLVPLKAIAELIRINPNSGDVGGHFPHLTSKQFDLIEALYMRRPLVRKKKTPKKKGILGLFGN